MELNSTRRKRQLRTLLIFLLWRQRLRRTYNRSTWVSEIRLLRTEYGEFHTLVPYLNDVEYKQYLRVTKEEFNEIHNLIRCDITKQFTTFREPISSQERLTVCLRFLASGESYRDMGFHFHMGESTISEIVREVCDSIWRRMQPIYLPEPDEEFWKTKASEFHTRWRFKNCLSAIDGKHVIIRKPLHSGSDNFNYKKSFSIVLMAGADASYKFTFIDAGVKGRFSDGFIFRNSNFGKKLYSGELNIPNPSPLFDGGQEMPFVFVGDAAFGLHENIMRPYPGTSASSNMNNRIFNYRLSHARQVIECAFGILSARFRIYKRALELQPEVVKKLIKATCVLHNYLRRHEKIYEEEVRDIPAENFTDPVDQLIDLPRTKSRATRMAYDIREKFKDYFVNVDVLPWQEQAVRKGKY